MRLFVLIFILLIRTSSQIFAGIFVSFNGNDITGDGTIGNPFKTFSKASFVASPGDTIFIRGGIFTEKQKINGNNGVLMNKIYIMPYNGEIPVLDGANSGINEYEGLLTVTRNFYTIYGLKIINSPGFGIRYTGVNNLKISNCEISRSYSSIIRGWGNYDTVENCIFNNNVLKNENGILCIQGHGWPEGVACGFNDPGTVVSNYFVFRNNTLHRTWGEAIYLIGCHECTIDRNTVFNNFSVNVGIGRSQKINVTNNYIYTDTDSLNRPDLHQRADGIYMANELSTSWNNKFVDSITIANNIVAGCRAGVRFWKDPSNPSDSNTYSNIDVLYNDFSDIKDRSINFDSIPATHVQPMGCRLINNIILPGISPSLLYNIVSWSVINNDFVNSIPVWALDTSNLAVDPEFINPVTGGNPDGFKLQSSSGCSEKGLPIPQIQTDYWGNARDPDNTTPGAFEINQNTGATRIDNVKVRVYPNPVHEKLFIDTPGESEIRIFNLIGKVLISITKKERKIIINLQEFPFGIYILSINMNGNYKTWKILKF